MAEKTVVAKALEAFGQDMQQEAANELVRLQRQGFLPGLVAIILVAKTDLAVVDDRDLKQPSVSKRPTPDAAAF